MAKLVLNDITSGYNLASTYNDNNEATETAMENTLSRDGTSPNEMAAELNMGSNRIVNLGAPTNNNDAVRLIDVANIVAGGDINIDTEVEWSTGILNIPATVDNIADLVDPNADRLIFWDDSAGAIVYLTLGTGLSITGTTISATVASVAYSGITSVPAYITSLGLLTDPNADRFIFWDDSAGNLAQATIGTGLSISGTTLSLSHLGLESLTDPNADRILFWDDSAGFVTWLTVGTGLSVSGTTLSLGATLTSLGALTDPNADRIVFWDDSAGNYANLEPTGHLAISGTQIAYTSTTGSFTGTLTGVTGTVTGSVKYSKNGNVVTLEFPDITGTSNSTAHTITGAPAAVIPATTQRAIGITTNNGADAFGIVEMGAGGVLTLFNGLSATFSGTSTEGIKNCTITYHLS